MHLYVLIGQLDQSNEAKKRWLDQSNGLFYCGFHPISPTSGIFVVQEGIGKTARTQIWSFIHKKAHLGYGKETSATRAYCRACPNEGHYTITVLFACLGIGRIKKCLYLCDSTHPYLSICYANCYLSAI